MAGRTGKKSARLEGNMSYCYRCVTAQLHGATVCRICCAPLGIDHAAPMDVDAAELVLVSPTMPPAGGSEAVFANWPFGGVDADAAAQVAAHAFAARVRAELNGFASRSSAPQGNADNGTFATSQSATYSLAEGSPKPTSAMPAQRSAKPQVETHSVPSVGPNPFLAAARIQKTREEDTVPEAYTA